MDNINHQAGGGGQKRARMDTPAPSKVDNCTNKFALADFIAPAVVQYLGVRSLVRFSSVCTSYKAVVSNEVDRRKAEIIAIEAKVKELMGAQPENVPARANVVVHKGNAA